MGAYHQLIHNLHITPVSPEVGSAPEDLFLAVEPVARNELPEDRLAETKIIYTTNSKTRFVHIFVDRLPLEDTPHE